MNKTKYVILLILALIFLTLISCSKKGSPIKEISVTKEGFLVELNEKIKTCRKVRSFIFLPEEGDSGISFQKSEFENLYGYVDSFIEDERIHFLLKYKSRAEASEIPKFGYLLYNTEYDFVMMCDGLAFIYSKILIKNKNIQQQGEINFENINPSDYEIIILEQRIRNEWETYSDIMSKFRTLFLGDSEGTY